MRFTVKPYLGDATIKFNGKNRYVPIAHSFETFLNGKDRVEVSTKPFNGCTKVTLESAKKISGDAGFYVTGKNFDRVFVCSSGLRRFGIKGSETKNLYIKVRK